MLYRLCRRKSIEMSTLIIICGLLLIVVAAWQTVQKARGKAKSSCCGTAEAVPARKVEDTDESHYPYRYTLTIEGMMCSNCARNVENTLNAMGGVWARVNLGRREAKVLSKVPRERQAFSDALSPTAYTVTDWRED